MKSGKVQNDSVSGEAKLSCTRATVRSVGRLDGGRRLRHLLGPDRAGVLQMPCARRQRRLAASMRLSSRSRPSRRNTLTCDAVSRLPCNSTPCAWNDGDALRRQGVVGLPQPKLAAGQRQRSAAGLEIRVVHRLGAPEHHRRQRAHRAVVDQHAEQQRAERRRGEEFPGGNAGGARNDQLGRTRQPPEAQHAAEQHRERQHLHGNIGQAQRGDLAHQA